eukprot:363291-Chlamydomonas_euryale.AAC.26
MARHIAKTSIRLECSNTFSCRQRTVGPYEVVLLTSMPMQALVANPAHHCSHPEQSRHKSRSYSIYDHLQWWLDLLAMEGSRQGAHGLMHGAASGALRLLATRRRQLWPLLFSRVVSVHAAAAASVPAVLAPGAQHWLKGTGGTGSTPPAARRARRSYVYAGRSTHRGTIAVAARKA